MEHLENVFHAQYKDYSMNTRRKIFFVKKPNEKWNDLSLITTLNKLSDIGFILISELLRRIKYNNTISQTTRFYLTSRATTFNHIKPK